MDLSIPIQESVEQDRDDKLVSVLEDESVGADAWQKRNQNKC
jgi:hypothetical protein